LKKRTKKLLRLGVVATQAPEPPISRSFFASFFSKKEDSYFLEVIQ
jgi:hypothetical protein